MYKLLIRPILFLFDPEKVHYFTFSLVKFISKIPLVTSIIKAIYVVEDKRLEREVFGLKFKNPVGLAAGFDKNAVLYNELANFGFGFIEIGKVSSQNSGVFEIENSGFHGSTKEHADLVLSNLSKDFISSNAFKFMDMIGFGPTTKTSHTITSTNVLFVATDVVPLVALNT